MTCERLGCEEVLKKVPDSVFILAHLATFAGIGDTIALATVAARLNRAGINRVGLGYIPTEIQNQVISLVSSEIDFQPVPEGLFDQKLPLINRLRGYRDSLDFQRLLMGFERVALLGASAVRFLPKSPLRFRLDVFSQDVFWQDQLLVDSYALTLGKRYSVAGRLDHDPVELSISPKYDSAISDWAKQNDFNLSFPFWVVNLGTGKAEKTWPLERYLTISDWFHQQTKAPIIFINPPNDFCTLQQLIRSIRKNPNNYLFASAEIGETAVLIKKAQGYIGGDTGFTHIAAALGIPLILIYPEINLRVWKPITTGQKMTIVSGESVEIITCEQVFQALSPNIK